MPRCRRTLRRRRHPQGASDRTPTRGPAPRRPLIELVEEGSALAALPIVRWARRFDRGTVRLHGGIEPTCLCGSLHLGAAELEVAFTFRGGDSPSITALALIGPMVIDGVAGTSLDIEEEAVLLDGTPIDVDLRADHVLADVVEHLRDVAAWASLDPDGALCVKFPHGVQAELQSGAQLTMEARSSGDPGSLTLTEPLRLMVGGEGLRLSHQRFRRLSSLASLRLEGATLHPDGKVQLTGGASRGIDRVMRSGLERASARLSSLVRQSPRFAKVRTFLKT